MNLSEERRALRRLLAMPDSALLAAAINSNQVLKNWPVAVHDQIDSATRDAYGLALEIAALGGMTHFGQPGSRSLKKYLAALVRCMNGTHCPHMDATRPVTGILAARVIACKECLPTFLPQIDAAMQRNLRKQDMTCDLCLEESEFFYPVTLHAGSVVLQGDACRNCNQEAMEGETGVDIHDGGSA